MGFLCSACSWLSSCLNSPGNGVWKQRDGRDGHGVVPIPGDLELRNPRLVWVGSDLKAHPTPPPPRAGTLSLAQVAPSPAQLVLGDGTPIKALFTLRRDTQ